MLVEATDELSLLEESVPPEESELSELSELSEASEVSGSLELSDWSDDSPDDEDDPPPLQEITRRLKINTIRKKRSFFIFFSLILRKISFLPKICIPSYRILMVNCPETY